MFACQVYSYTLDAALITIIRFCIVFTERLLTAANAVHIIVHGSIATLVFKTRALGKLFGAVWVIGTVACSFIARNVQVLQAVFLVVSLHGSPIPYIALSAWVGSVFVSLALAVLVMHVLGPVRRVLYIFVVGCHMSISLFTCVYAARTLQLGTTHHT